MQRYGCGVAGAAGPVLGKGSTRAMPGGVPEYLLLWEEVGYHGVFPRGWPEYLLLWKQVGNQGISYPEGARVSPTLKKGARVSPTLKTGREPGYLLPWRCQSISYSEKGREPGYLLPWGYNFGC